VNLDDARIAVLMGGVRARGAQPQARVTVGDPQAKPWDGRREPDSFAEPPPLGDGDPIGDFETDGNRWWAGARPGGVAMQRPDGTSFYLAWGHRGGGNNISPENALAWWRANMRGRRLINHTTGYEIHMSREWGHDLEDAGCTATDVAHTAALIDDQRKRLALKELCEAYLPPDERKVEAVGGTILDPSRMMDYPASVVGVRALADVRQVGLLEAMLQPRIDELGLRRVQDLEDSVIWAVCDMEKNAAPLDVELLRQYLAESEAEIDALRREIAKDMGSMWQDDLFGGTGDGFLNPDSPKDMEKLFRALGLELVRAKPTQAELDAAALAGRDPLGRPSFTAEVLRSVDHPTVAKVLRQAQLLDLRSKFLVPYWDDVRDGGPLRFRLHQCRWSDDKKEGGTRRGRFSASDKNIQQVMKVKKQLKAYGNKYIIRRLFVGGEDPSRPGGRRRVVSADARQIEYRIFAHYEGSQDVIDAFARDPYMDMHDFTTARIKAHIPEIDRDGGKTCNFLYVYGGGLAKLNLALGLISKAQFDDLNDEFKDSPYGPPRDHPLLARGLKILEIYERVLPGVKPLKRKATRLANERGYVKDILGRRATFPGGFGTHAALNAVIQPSAAEVMKQKMVEVRAAHRAGLLPFLARMTVHDELFGDKLADDCVPRLRALLDRQSFAFKVPILWDVNEGDNWAESK
jgi:DNA polymerase I-like protein with 3'-5' exonuclease and polymerase domains